MKTRTFSKLLIGVCAVMLAVGLTTEAMAQQLRYQTRYSKAQVGNTIRKLENSSDVFSRAFKRALDNSRRNGTNAEDRYTQTVENFENAMDRLRSEFDRSDSWWETRQDVSQVMDESRSVNTMMNRLSFRRNLERQWIAMRTDINSLADTFDLPGLNGGGWNGGNNGNWNGGNNGGWNNSGARRPPSWAQGVFYGVAPNGTQIMLTISANGHITANIGGSINDGTYLNNNRMRMNEAISIVTRYGNGIRTTRTDNREVINYSRTGSNGPGWNGGNNGGGWTGNETAVTPPNWARGTFYGTAPNGTQIALTISSNGQVTANIGGGMSYGKYLRNNTLRMNEALSSVTSIRNGIRTTRTDNGEVIEYRRSR